MEDNLRWKTTFDGSDLSDGSPIDLNNFNIAHYNINSMTAFGRLDQLSDICATLKFDVLILTESKLDNTIPSSVITLPGYHEPLRRVGIEMVAVF